MGTGQQLLPQRRSAGGSWGEASSHLGEDQGKLLVALDSSVDKRARVKNATGQPNLPCTDGNAAGPRVLQPCVAAQPRSLSTSWQETEQLMDNQDSQDC